MPSDRKSQVERVQRLAAHATYDAIMRMVRPVLERRIGDSPRAQDTIAAVGEAVDRGVLVAVGHAGRLTDEWALRQEAMERILDAAEAQARDQITYLPGPRIEHDDPRRAKWKVEGEQLQRDIALVSDRCFAVLHHGPGHQSTTRCELRGTHAHHSAEVMGEQVEWTGNDESTGFFDELSEVD